MRDLVILFIHLMVTLARLIGPFGMRSVVAESVLVKHQLLILNRSRARSPSLRTSDRLVAGLCAFLMLPARLIRSAIVLKPSTLLSLHQALRNRKYRLLFSSKRRGKPGPKGPSKELIEAIVQTKERNPTWGCPRIAQQIGRTGSLSSWTKYTRRIIGFGVHAGTVDGFALCRMFNRAIRGHRSMPKHLSSDHDPLYSFHQWQANLRILGVSEIKTVSYVPLSHPFVERLIGSIRREYLDRTLFWTSPDLENKLLDFRTYFNDHRTHTSREGRTPDTPVSRPIANPYSYRWQPHCRGLYQTPIAA